MLNPMSYQWLERKYLNGSFPKKIIHLTETYTELKEKCLKILKIFVSSLNHGNEYHMYQL